MDILVRSEAKNKGLKTYYTGKLCKNGHDSYRYTNSGACAKCVRENNGEVNDKSMSARRDVRSKLFIFTFRIFDVDVDNFALAVWSSVVMRYPDAQLNDVYSSVSPKNKAAGTAMYSFYCHSEDLETLRTIANEMCSSHKFDAQEARRKALNASQGYQDPISSTTLAMFTPKNLR